CLYGVVWLFCRGGARPKCRTDHTEHLRAAHWSGFDAAMTKGATKLQGRPTLTRALHKSGRRLYVEMTFAIIKGDTESEVLGAVAMARDVTERVERERAASRSS